jgi:hypothetical protein
VRHETNVIPKYPNHKQTPLSIRSQGALRNPNKRSAPNELKMIGPNEINKF